MEYNFIDSIISEASLRVNDRTFTEIDKSIYTIMYYRVCRKLALKYKLITRVYELEDIYDKDKDIPVNIQSFIAENRVYINDKEYHKVDYQLEDGKYRLYKNENSLFFNYQPRVDKAKIVIYYSSDINVDDFELEEIKPVIPTHYNDELINMLVVEICKIGVGKYIGSGVGEKYNALLQMYFKNPNEINPNLTKNKEWIKIKVYQPY